MLTGPPPIAPSSERPTRVRWLILALACGSSFLLYLHRYTWGFVKDDLQKSMGWSQDQIGWLDGVFYGTYAVGQVPSGMIADRWGTRWLLATIIAAWSLSLSGIAVAGRFVPMLLARAVFGLAQAGCYPALGKVTRQWIPWTVRTSAQGWVATFFGRFGGAVSQLVVGLLLVKGTGLDWRWALIGLSVVGIGYALLFAMLFRSTPREHPMANAAEVQLIEMAEPRGRTAPAASIPWRTLLADVNVRLLCLQQALAVCADNLYVNWLATYLRQQLSQKPDQAGWQVFVPLTASAIAGPIAAWVQDRLLRAPGRHRQARSFPTTGAFLTAGVCFVAAMSVAHNAWAFVLVLTAAKFFADWGQPAVWGTITDISGRQAGSLFGLVNMCGSLAGLVVGPLSGWILRWASGGTTTNAAGWQALFVFTASMYGLLALVWLFVDATRRIAVRPSS
jgi:ACS family glucarate transporter-like MFS transporter